ncbi:S-adenosyl-L-methionine-dependent methyltransferase [Jackrogersella minutella]|nr:S-adenosyl-L-methionine-dependent methyltransferase [Jackrogersella minutella]
MANVPASPGEQSAAQPQTTASNEPELIAATHDEDEAEDDFNGDDADSALGEDAASSTNSITASILEYRTIQGRTYHSDRHESSYFAPNDEQQMHSQDITHHYLSVMLKDKLFLAPIKDDVEKILDVGTGTGDQFPEAEVTGTDLSPTQPLWVPSNVKFEIDDCIKEWTWPDNNFDFIHMRYLFGAISDWNALFRQAFRCCKPGGWVQSCECDCMMSSDDGSIKEDGVVATFWNPLWAEMSKLGPSFKVLEERRQNKGFEEAGFVDITEVNYKLPIGGWPMDPKLAEVGGLALLTLINDLEGYTIVPWNIVHGENTPGYQETLAFLRKELRSRSMHSYMKIRYVYGRKPESA